MKEWGRDFNLTRELVAKDIKIMYSQPLFGFLWVFLSPFFMVLIFYLVFGIILKVDSEEVPFVLYLMSGVFPWIFFRESLMRSVTSLMDNKNLIKESRFPYYLLPLSIVINGMINFLPSLLILIIGSFIILKGVSPLICLLPFILLIHFFLVLGISLIMAILYVRWRDIRYLLESLLHLLFYLTPTCYALSTVRDAFPFLLFKIYLYNPLVGILTLYRVSIFESFRIDLDGLFGIFGIQIISIIFIFMIALYLYKKNADTINDYLAY